MKNIIFLISIFFSINSIAQVDTKNVGDWVYNTRRDFIEIYTSNGSGSTFGMLCSRNSKVCNFYITTSIVCQKGARLPVILNAEGTVIPMNVECSIWAKRSGEIDIYWFEDRRQIIDLLFEKKIFGIALPLNDGTFVVSRFSLDGYMDAFIFAAEELGVVNSQKLRDARQ